ncbi:lytic transglycosylase domain-containing protein [Hydrocarboniclastica marina]|uniref:Lytic transglycosylase domain-containing protein n=1 Tax=Hydrocarboniclastica marina TaxID=2259620 RepID=A0A4P7XGD1_9ALTE|nr:lytic transglycosylase domain-containing protein [Hydrocarboniclastica marina]QCF25765.1 lytic transglycosylase domain-containing protein [Hydrocarboniclastica marina]
MTRKHAVLKALVCSALLLSVTPVVAQTPDSELRAVLKQTIEGATSFEDRFDAEVWLVDMSGRTRSWIKDDDERLEILRLIHQEAQRIDLEPELLLALIHVESLYDRFAVSSAGAQGLMQVMPFWKNEIGRPDDNLTQIKTNLRYGSTILRHYLDIEKGNLTRALARYNGSLGKTWYPERVMNAWDKYYFVRN